MEVIDNRCTVQYSTVRQYSQLDFKIKVCLFLLLLHPFIVTLLPNLVFLAALRRLYSHAQMELTLKNAQAVGCLVYSLYMHYLFVLFPRFCPSPSVKRGQQGTYILYLFVVSLRSAICQEQLHQHCTTYPTTSLTKNKQTLRIGIAMDFDEYRQRGTL